MTNDLETTYRQIIAAQPNRADAHNNLGNVLAAKGNLESARASYQQALKLNPNYTQAYNNLGNVFMAQGNLEEAIASYQRAVILNPNYIEAHYNLGNALFAIGNFATAKVHYQQAISLKPDFCEAYNNQGLVLQEEGDLDRAIASYQRAIILNPNYSEAYNNLGNAFEVKGDVLQAIASYQQAIILNPSYVDAYNNLGNVFSLQGNIESAIASYQQAISLNPNYAQAYYNLGNAVKNQGNLEEAIAYLRRAITLQPNFAQAHKVLGIALLLAGDLKNGFAEYEWRYQTKEYTGGSWDYPLWDGQDLQARKILLLCDQGFGDAIQFIRYAPLIAQQNGTVIVACYPELLRLFATIPGIETVTNGEVVDFDVHSPLMSLPYFLGTTLETIPAQIPYISAPKPYPFTLSAPTAKLKVGIVWAGNPNNRNDRHRSCELRDFLPLLLIEEIAFFSLQKGARTKDLTELDLVEIQDLSAQLSDFADTAAAIAQLDLVVTVDTSVAHLAGAMGKPVWVLLSFVADWRWMTSREDSPWYPTMRLFRQSQPGDWTQVFERVAIELNNWIAQMKRRLKSRLHKQNLPTQVLKLLILRKEAQADLVCIDANSIRPDSDNFNRQKQCRWGNFLYNINDIIGRSFDLYGEYCEGEIELFQQIVQPQDLIVEVGANIGFHTVFFARSVGAQGTVLAFEPQRILFQTLCANLALNSLTNTYCYNLALGDAVGAKKVPVFNPRKPNNFEQLDPSANIEGELVQVMPLDSLNIPYCRLIKINTEQMGLQVLQGAANTINRLRPILSVKNNITENTDVVRYIESFGYRIYRHKTRLYNSNNYCQNPQNIFGDRPTINLLCIDSKLSLNLSLELGELA